MSHPLPASLARLLPLLVTAWVAAACDVTVGMQGRAVERETKDFPVSGVPDLTLVTFDGSIEIRAWDRPEVSIEIEKHASSKEALGQIHVNATQSGNRISVEVRDAEQERRHFGFSGNRSARLIVSVPRQVNIEARSGDGSVAIERVNGRVRLETGDGSIKVTEINGELRAHTGDGSMTLERVDGRVDAETGDGTISVSGRLEAVRLQTGDGSVRLRADSGSRMADTWEIHTGDGSVGLELPASLDADIDAHANDGSVSVHDLDVKGDVTKSAVRGQLGAGGRTMRVTSGGGSITISRS
jgi:DUF4097 and DUF4098 domain-containing protein YvlB